MFAAACGDDSTFIDAAPTEADARTIDSNSDPIDADTSIDADTTVDAQPIDGTVAVDAAPDATIGVDAAPDAMIAADASVPDAFVPADAFVPPDAFIPPDAMISADAFVPPDAMVSADAGVSLAPTLLITEVKTVDNSEFVEIYNPTNQTISLRNYYLSDLQTYFQLPAHVAGNVTLTADASDFMSRFPVGASIAPYQVITVATDAVGFETAFTAVPTYTVQELGNSIAMETIVIGPSSPNPGFTNAGEMVALFFWDGASDRVQDVDLVIGGNAPTAANNFTMKTPVDGPDGDALPTAYAVDTVAMQDMQTDSPNATSYKRILFEAGNEIQLGTGNGITGDDEMSEAVRTTWDSQATATNYTAGTPGTIPAALQ